MVLHRHPEDTDSASGCRVIVLTYSNQLDERHSEVVLIRHTSVLVLLVDAVQGEAEQCQQRRYGEAEVELEVT